MAERVEDLKLPSAVVSRIMKDSLPNNVAIGKEARNAVARAASVFVLYLTSSANNVATKAKRKVVSGNDVMEALGVTDFDMYTEPLQEAWDVFKQMHANKGKKGNTAEEGDHDDDMEVDEEEAEGEDDDEGAE